MQGLSQSLYHDRGNSRLYFIECNNGDGDNEFLCGYIDLTDDSVTELGGLDYDEGPNYNAGSTTYWRAIDIFHIGSNHYINMEYINDDDTTIIYDIDSGITL